MSRRTASTVIIAMLLAGVLTLALNVQTIKSDYAHGSMTQVYNSWECTGNFTKGDVIMIEFSPNMFWFNDSRAFDLLGDGTPIMYIDINITDPQNGQSQYELWYTYDITNTSRIGLYNATLLYAAGGINSTVYLPSNFTAPYIVAGTTELNGMYLGNVTFVGYAIDFRVGGQFPPSAFALHGTPSAVPEFSSFMILLSLMTITLVIAIPNRKRVDLQIPPQPVFALAKED